MAAPVRRPLLIPSLMRVWRGTNRLQLGVATERPVVLAGLDPHDVQFLLDLDGRHDHAAALRQASVRGLTTSRAEQLLGLVDAAGCLADGASDARGVAALDPADRGRLAADLAALSLSGAGRSLGLPELARRRRGHVEVRGAGRVGAAVTTLLAAAGVGAVTVIDDGAVAPADVAPLGPAQDSIGRPRSDAAVEAARRTTPSLARDRAGRPDLVVLTDEPVINPADSDDLVAAGVAHLPITLVETTAVVGPLVRPGQGPCLRCVDLHRQDRDRDWPLVAAQLSRDRDDPGPAAGVAKGAVDACDVVLATAAASLAALQVLAWLDADGPTEGGDGQEGWEPGTSYVLRLPGGRTRRRIYSEHPRCGCSWGGRQ